MQTDPRTPHRPDQPLRLDNGALDLDHYIRRAHRLRSEQGIENMRNGARFLRRLGRPRG